MVEHFITNTMSKLYAFILGFILISCQQSEDASSTFQRITGEAQGTTYNIVVDTAGLGAIKKQEIDSIFLEIDSSLSVWKESSIISDFNTADSIVVSDSHFLTVYYRSRELYNLTEGAFNIQIAPLVKAWGFGKEGVKPVAKLNPDSLLQWVHMDIETSVDSLNEAIVFRKQNGQSIDVNGIAQGYTVDVISDFLKSKSATNFMAEVGGEVVAQGTNDEGDKWRIGIDKPVSDLTQREMQAVAEISGKALATSGSYRKYYELDGKKYSHTIDPKSGLPVEHSLLSVSVLTTNCTNADAFATAFMVMGKNKTLDFLEKHPELKLDVYLISGKEDGSLETYASDGFAIAEKNED